MGAFQFAFGGLAGLAQLRQLRLNLFAGSLGLDGLVQGVQFGCGLASKQAATAASTGLAAIAALVAALVAATAATTATK